MPLKPWKTLDSRYLLKERWITLRADRVETAQGVVLDPYYVQEPPDWVHVVAFDDDMQVLVIRQYRHAAGKVMLELPCGAVDPGELPLDAMTRELLEETGCACERVETLPPLSPNPANLANLMHQYVGFGTRVVAAQSLDETEEIEFGFMPVNELMARIRAGEFQQALHLGTLYRALELAGMLDIREP